jgi:hypothetical protein
MSGGCVVASATGEVAEATNAAFAANGWTVGGVGPWSFSGGKMADTLTSDFDETVALCRSSAAALGQLGAVVVHSAGIVPDEQPRRPQPLAWREQILRDLRLHAAWLRAVLLAPSQGPRISVVNVVSPSPVSGIVAQAVGQLARCTQASRTPDRVSVFTVEIVEPGDRGLRSFAALSECLCRQGAPELAAEELVVGADWIGLRAHPVPACTVSFSEGTFAPWIDDVLRSALMVPPLRL